MTAREIEAMADALIFVAVRHGPRKYPDGDEWDPVAEAGSWLVLSEEEGYVWSDAGRRWPGENPEPSGVKDSGTFIKAATALGIL